MFYKLHFNKDARAKISNSQYEVTFKGLFNKTVVWYHKEHSVVGFQLQLKRWRAPIIINTYLPCMMLILISFIGFLIPVHMVPGRMALLVTIFLMLVNISSSVKAEGPKVRLE